MKKVENNMIFTQTITVKCLECEQKLTTEARFEADGEGNIKLNNIKTKDTGGWRMGIFKPGLLHPARGGVPQQGVKYQEPGMFVACPDHVMALRNEDE